MKNKLIIPTIIIAIALIIMGCSNIIYNSMAEKSFIEYDKITYFDGKNIVETASSDYQATLYQTTTGDYLEINWGYAPAEYTYNGKRYVITKEYGKVDVSRKVFYNKKTNEIKITTEYDVKPLNALKTKIIKAEIITLEGE